MLKSFAFSESGAATVDWVVLTAGLVGFGLVVGAIVAGGVEDLSGEVQEELGSQAANIAPFEGEATLGDHEAIE